MTLQRTPLALALVSALALTQMATARADDAEATTDTPQTTSLGTVHVQADGRYSLRSLPTGVYNVTLEHDGNALVMHKNVTVAVGRGVNVDFDCGQDDCAKADSRS